MTDSEWKDAWELVLKLWPKLKECGHEREQSFRRVCGKATPNEVERAIRAVDETCRYTPKPVDRRTAIRGGRSKAIRVADEKPRPSWPDLIRQQMSGCTGHILPEHAAMSDSAAQAWYWSAMVVAAHRWYCRRAQAAQDRCEFCDDHPAVKALIEKREQFARLAAAEAYGQEGAA